MSRLLARLIESFKDDVLLSPSALANVKRELSSSGWYRIRATSEPVRERASVRS